MLGKTVAVLALAASCVVIGVQPSLASTENSPWSQTNGNAAQSRVNLTEKVLTPAAVTKVRPLRSVLAPLRPQNPACGPTGISAPVLAGGYVYAMTNYKLSKYNAATGRLIWRTNPDPTFVTHYDSLAVSGNLVIVGGDDSCITESEISGSIFAFNASTGALVWSANTQPESGFTGAVVSARTWSWRARTSAMRSRCLTSATGSLSGGTSNAAAILPTSRWWSAGWSCPTAVTARATRPSRPTSFRSHHACRSCAPSSRSSARWARRHHRPCGRRCRKSATRDGRRATGRGARGDKTGRGGSNL